jgi:aerobic-type carbon monoxide dehydrogenase small subunit (CoxS/CutS family)
MKDLQPIALRVNGVEHQLVVDSRITLADVLRHELGRTGTHVGCEHGICGACTVLLDGQPVRACLMFGVQADGCHVQTVEGLGVDGELSDLQQAFSDSHGLQCGFCTPGMLMLAEGLLASNPDPSASEIRETMASNLCRCTGYQGILDAVAETARRRRAAADQAP